MKARLRHYASATKELVRRELQANVSPFKASVSLTVGVLIAFSPFFGLHYAMAVPLAFILRLNRPLTLLGVSVTVFPTIPLVIAAGFFIGRMVISPEQANCILDACKKWFPDGTVDSIIAFGHRVIPDHISGLIVRDSGAGVTAGVIQWFIGGSILAVACAIGTFAIIFPIFYQVNAVLRRRGTRTKGTE